MKKISLIKTSTLALAFVLLGATVGTVYAFGPGGGYGLTDEQRTVLEEARDLRQEGNFEAAEELLEANELDRGSFQERRQARHENREVVHAAVEENNYQAYLSAVAGTPREDVSEAEFMQIVEAHELREVGDFDGAREIMEELGFQGNGPGGMKGGCHGQGGRGLGSTE